MNFMARQRPRELRRRVNIRARLRAKGGWTDARILNISSRGLLISASARSPVQGTTIELWHGDNVIVGTVVWQEGTRAGVHSNERVPVNTSWTMARPRFARPRANGPGSNAASGRAATTITG